MDTVNLVPSISSTRIGFGCGGLMRDASARRRQRVLAAAFEQGITHFDVARMYGLGAAESELGRFAIGRRDRLVIATKFGIEATVVPRAVAAMQGPLRALLARFPAIRNYARGRTRGVDQPRYYDADGARKSLETSLRQLRTDYVDLLFVHDPGVRDVVDLPGICAYLEDARRKGYIRAWGVAGEQDPCIRIREAMAQPAVLQVRDDIFSRAAGLSEELQPAVTFGVISGALPRISGHFAESPELVSSLSQAVGADCSSRDTLVSLLLQDALQANRRGVVLLSTTRPERLSDVDALVSRAHGQPAQLRVFRQQIELAGA
jgi:D-threo-aldose 1-dehydrogenase